VASTVEVLTTADRHPWMAALSRVAQYDFYHLPQWHELAERNGEGRAQLFVQFGAGSSTKRSTTV
jgi:hypothetical protein